MRSIVIALFSLLAACSTFSPGTAYQDAEKALIAAHDAEKVVADAYVITAPSLSPDVKAQIVSALDQSHAVLVAADTLTDAPSILAAINAATPLIEKAKTLEGTKP